MKRMREVTADQQSIYSCCIHNLAQEVAYRIRRYNEGCTHLR